MKRPGVAVTSPAVRAPAEVPTHISLCRPGGEALVREELSAALRPAPIFPPAAMERPAAGAGWLAWQGTFPRERDATAPALIFERQRLPDAAWWTGERAGERPAELAAALAAETLPRLARSPAPCALHVFTPDPTGQGQGRSLSRRCERLAESLRQRWREAGTPPFPPEDASGGRRGTLWQVCLVEGGVWSSLAPAADLPSPWPGGVSRMQMDPAAPSRSYLKIEEALALLGRAPRPRERVIDLGAAPGGWSYAFLKRGCRVLAVDNGPLHIPDLEQLPGTLTHLREDGLRFRPPPGWVPADWLLSDMLVAPGVCLGLLRKWLGGGWLRRCIVNVKLPQRHPLAALAPMQDFLAEVPGLRWRLRQLYHDRREVTLLGELAGPVAAGTDRATMAGGAASPQGPARPGGRSGRRRRGR